MNPIQGTLSAPPAQAAPDSQLRKAFDNFVGETFYGQMLKALRESVGKPAYFDGGRAEEIFTQQFDQVMAQKMAQSNGKQLGDSMYKLFALGRK
jgi:Rod binding domain-containing protein